jgi:hypothetical protein
MGRFAAMEGDGEVGADGDLAQGPPRVAMRPGRCVDRHDRRGLLLDRPRQTLDRPIQRTRQTGAEQRVYIECLRRDLDR